MKPMKFGITAVFLAMAGPVSADGLKDQIVGQLRTQGFERVTVSRTFLGRTRIVALSNTHRREIVFNANGVILRDYWVLLQGEGPEGQVIVNPTGSGEEDEGEEDDDDDGEGDDGDGDEGEGEDDDDDDEDDEDNSGPGGGDDDDEEDDDDDDEDDEDDED